jgi:ADP-ribose pyrophosphatase
MTGPSPLPAHPDVTVESDETVWNGRFALQRIKFRQRQFDGTMSGPRTWELWRRGRAAALLPYDPVADVVVLIDQFRLPALAAGMAPVMVEVPAGLCDPGEDPSTTLLREAEEETGIVPRRLLQIGDFLLCPGGTDERVFLYIGEITLPPGDEDGIVGMAGLDAEHEDIRIRRWPAARAIEAALAGNFPNVVTTVALLWLAARRDHLRRIWGDAA